ncbi:hypothetical protein EVAR_76440_1 [Eumeta japonica]|uniref:Reverse transcriptase domain-containing protein n=1 Tax=Eumeta variegata TaxID=151549 RepID=A0A4C1T8Y8_EUMVA|nr:hypothetical protein EVAR_76440_1 [Eumeta japonica]
MDNFLTKRRTKIAIDGTCIDPKPVNAGVSQGCALFPTLFLLRINDLLKVNNTQIATRGLEPVASSVVLENEIRPHQIRRPYRQHFTDSSPNYQTPA